MTVYFDKFVNFFRPKNCLLLANIFLVFFLIVFSNAGRLPLETGNFIFFTILGLAFALYRPGWAFLFFVGTLPLENVNLAPEQLGLAVRPYQFIGTLIILALFIRYFSKRLEFKTAKITPADWAVIVLTASGFISAFAEIFGNGGRTSAFRLAVILASFGAFYFLSRNYIQNISDLKKVIPFALSSSVVVAIYGIWQNIRFARGLSSFETMPGRPNGTFSEANWLGLFIILVVCAVYEMIYYFNKKSDNKDDQIFNFQFSIFNQSSISEFLNYLLLTTFFIALILTVSRSAWLGAIVSLAMFVWIFFTDLKWKERWNWQETIRLKLKIIGVLLVAISAVYVFHLTTFQLGNRAQSTGSGLQKITVACEKNIALPKIIRNVSELSQYGCRFIRLEDIEKEKAIGNSIIEVYRQDPNVNIRTDIYKKSWEQIKEHLILGIGWGNISFILGTDERGTPLNSSNIFLETWLGAGILGLLAFVFLLLHIFKLATANFHRAQNLKQKSLAVFSLTSWFGIVIFNLFNAGMFLGFFWLWLAITQIKNSK